MEFLDLLVIFAAMLTVLCSVGLVLEFIRASTSSSGRTLLCGQPATPPSETGRQLGEKFTRAIAHTRELAVLLRKHADRAITAEAGRKFRAAAPLPCLLLALSVGPALGQQSYEFPPGVPLKAADVVWFAPTDHYQHNGSVHHRGYNISAVRSEPFGNANREFPWKTGGLDTSPNGESRLFHRFPAGSKIVWWVDPAKTMQTGNVQWRADRITRWRYPEGSIFGEVLRVDGKTFEVRIMTRGRERWTFQVYRPFANRADIGLPPAHQLGAAKLTSRHRDRRAFDSAAVVDELDLPAAKVAEVLARPFKDVTGAAWARRDDGLECFCPTASKPGQLVPVGYQGHHFGAQSCAKCHDTVGQQVRVFDVGRDWYGSVRGSDSVFSFSIFDDRCAARNGYNRPVRLNAALPLERR